MANQTIRLELKSYDHRILDKAVADIAGIVGDGLIAAVAMPNNVKKVVIHKSTHVYGSSKEKYEMKRHKRTIWIRPSADNMAALMQFGLPYGVEIYIKLLEAK